MAIRTPRAAGGILQHRGDVPGRDSPAKLQEHVRGVAVQNRHAVDGDRHLDLGPHNLVQLGSDFLFFPLYRRDPIPGHRHRAEAAQPGSRDRLQRYYRRGLHSTAGKKERWGFAGARPAPAAPARRGPGAAIRPASTAPTRRTAVRPGARRPPLRPDGTTGDGSAVAPAVVPRPPSLQGPQPVAGRSAGRHSPPHRRPAECRPSPRNHAPLVTHLSLRGTPPTHVPRPPSPATRKRMR